MKTKNTKELVFWILATVPLLMLIFWVVFPLLYLLLTSFKTPQVMFSRVPQFIFKPSFEVYKELLIIQGQWDVFLNSLVITCFTILFALILGSTSAFAFVHFNFKFKKLILFGILLTRMYPPITTLIPVYLMIAKLGLLDTRIGLIFVYTSFNLPLVVWIMRGYIEGIPKSIMESAMIDGCSNWKLFGKMTVPLSVPGILASMALVFVFTWNEFLFALILTSVEARTAPVSIVNYIEVDEQVQWSSVAVLGVLTILPILLITIIFQRYLVKGALSGALKE